MLNLLVIAVAWVNCSAEGEANIVNLVAGGSTIPSDDFVVFWEGYHQVVSPFSTESARFLAGISDQDQTSQVIVGICVLNLSNKLLARNLPLTFGEVRLTDSRSIDVLDPI